MSNEKIPILYAYIYRNLKEKNEGNILEMNRAIFIMKRILRKAPKIIYREICEELIQFQLLKKINRDNYIILNNPSCEKQIERLRDYIFPITP